MWFLMVVTIIDLVQSAQGGYEYPKPIIPFVLPNRILQNSEIQSLNIRNIDITKTLNNFLPNEDYRHSQQHTNEERIQNGVINTLLKSTVQSEQQTFEKGLKQNYLDSNNPTQFNDYIDATIPIQNVVPQSSLIKDLNPVKQPVLPTNYPKLILNIENNVPPLISLVKSENELLDDLRAPKNELPLTNLNINQGEAVHENNIQELVNIPQIEPQQIEYIDAQIVSQSRQNENTAIRTIPPNIQDFSPSVLNVLNSVQPYSGEFNEPIVKTQENQRDISNLNVEQTQFNVQNSEALYEEPNSQLSSLMLQSLTAANIATPVITKSISFHVPPPDIEDKSEVSGILPPRKSYKIIFVKTPSFENHYNQQQANLLSRLAPVEEKTIVYVLSKKPEITEQVVLPQTTKVSEHEVLYVQYKEDQKIDSEQISENVSQIPINSAGAAYIEPRLLDH